jgi:Papain family cysteine protease
MVAPLWTEEPRTFWILGAVLLSLGVGLIAWWTVMNYTDSAFAFQSVTEQQLLVEDVHKLRQSNVDLAGWESFVVLDSVQVENETEIDELRQFAYDPVILLPVRNQESCNSCWAFTISAVLANRVLLMSNGQERFRVPLSPQELMSCSTATTDCSVGGLLSTAVNYVRDRGLTPEVYCVTEDFKATGLSECALTTRSTYRVYIAADGISTLGFAGTYDPQNTDAIQKVVRSIQRLIYTQGPVISMIRLHGDSGDRLELGQLTARTVYKEIKSSVDHGLHAILIVGWGRTEEGEDYWVIQNSWGTAWPLPHPTLGPSVTPGYAYVARGRNFAGIEDYVLNLVPVLIFNDTQAILNTFTAFEVQLRREAALKQMSNLLLFEGIFLVMMGSTSVGAGFGPSWKLLLSLGILSVVSVLVVLLWFFLSPDVTSLINPSNSGVPQNDRTEFTTGEVAGTALVSASAASTDISLTAELQADIRVMAYFNGASYHASVNSQLWPAVFTTSDSWTWRTAGNSQYFPAVTKGVDTTVVSLMQMTRPLQTNQPHLQLGAPQNINYHDVGYAFTIMVRARNVVGQTGRVLSLRTYDMYELAEWGYGNSHSRCRVANELDTHDVETRDPPLHASTDHVFHTWAMAAEYTPAPSVGDNMNDGTEFRIGMDGYVQPGTFRIRDMTIGLAAVTVGETNASWDISHIICWKRMLSAEELVHYMDRLESESTS